MTTFTKNYIRNLFKILSKDQDSKTCSNKPSVDLIVWMGVQASFFVSNLLSLVQNLVIVKTVFATPPKDQFSKLVILLNTNLSIYKNKNF